MDPARSALNHKIIPLGRLVDEHLNVFHIETALNNRMYGPELDFLLKNEDDFTAFDRMKYEAMRYTMGKLPRQARRKMLHSRPAQYEMTACHAGKTDLVHEKIVQRGFDQYIIPVRGQCDILITGIPDISPYNVYSILNPLLVQVMRSAPLQFLSPQVLRKRRRFYCNHPCYDESVRLISYIEFFHRLLPRCGFHLAAKSTSASLHPRACRVPSWGALSRAHPFLCGTKQNGRQHVGGKIVAKQNAHVPAILAGSADNLTGSVAWRAALWAVLRSRAHQPMIGIADMGNK
jgi:hypothetical protein